MTSLAKRTIVIDDVERSKEAVGEILNSRDSTNGKIVVGLDCEGVDLGADGELTLLQISTTSGQVYIFDVYVCPDIFKSGELHRILESKDVLKVIQDCRGDSANLYYQFGITLINVFDTQAAQRVISIQRFRHNNKRSGLDFLCREYAVPVNSQQKVQIRDIFRKDIRFWTRRPLTEDMINYASDDAKCLMPLYHAMQKLIKPTSQKLFDELCEKQLKMFKKGQTMTTAPHLW